MQFGGDFSRACCYSTWQPIGSFRNSGDTGGRRFCIESNARCTDLSRISEKSHGGAIRTIERRTFCLMMMVLMMYVLSWIQGHRFNTIVELAVLVKLMKFGRFDYWFNYVKYFNYSSYLSYLSCFKKAKRLRRVRRGQEGQEEVSYAHKKTRRLRRTRRVRRAKRRGRIPISFFMTLLIFHLFYCLINSINSTALLDSIDLAILSSLTNLVK